MTARQKLIRLKERIRDSEDLSDDDREALLDFSRQMDLLQTVYSDHRHEKLLRHCTIMAENVGGLADAREDRDAAERLVEWINDSYSNEETNSDYRGALRKFGQRSLRLDEIPDSLAWIPTGTSRSYDPSPNIEEMLTWDDVQAMISAAQNTRDKALFALALEAGPRGYSELYPMTVGSLTDTSIGMQLTVDGKTGERHLTLIYSVPHLRRWLSDHPDRSNSDAPLWSKLSGGGLPSNPSFLNQFKNAAERAGVEKPVTPTNFRKSNTLFLRRLGADQSLIEDRQGRSRGSKHVARYIAAFDESNERAAYAGLLGHDVVEDDAPNPEDLTPVICPRCDKQTPREKDFCMWCDQALDPLAAKEFEETEQTVKRLTLRRVRDDPTVLDDVEERNTIINAIADDDDLLARAQALVDEDRQ
ncbi:tyrosine-type recombinase/integrase [Halomarina litorea]|uniref:tyrosine-type recombinase/integrase n=1 Tax=Halomarina litorea TaxID=2961595 RepID=UPI0020C3C128|nr:tyrosine-type recombinase/integrase [Halomarina sp. BCD28]